MFSFPDNLCDAKPTKPNTRSVNLEKASDKALANVLSQMIFKDMYCMICHINQSVRLPISKFVVG